MSLSGKMSLYPSHPNLKVFEVAQDNLPDGESVMAASEILKLCSSLTDKDGLIVCCSGGGSACLSLPIEGLGKWKDLLEIQIV